MTKMDKPAAFSRRALLKGAIVVSIGAPLGLDTLLSMNAAQAQGTKPPLMPDQLSSYIAINADGTVSAFFGKMDMGHGLFVAIGQMVAEELDVPFKSVTVHMGDTATSVNQGGASGSTGIQLGGRQMRMAAAEARRVLLGMAAEKLGTPADQLIVVERRDQRRVQSRQEDVLCGADRRALFQRPARLEQAVGQPTLRARQGAAEAAHRAQNRRPVDQARGRGAEGVRPGGLLHRHQGARHGAWPGDPAAGRRRGAGRGRRELDQGHSGRQGRPREGFPRPRRREGVGRGPGRREAQGGMVERVSGLSRDGRHLRPHPQGAGAQARRGQAHGQHRRSLPQRRARRRGRIRMAVPVPCLHGAGLRAGRDQGRAGDLLDRLAEIPLRARRRRRDAGPAAREGARHLGAGPRRLRPQRCGRCRDGCGGARQGHRAGGAPAIHARSGHRLGSQGPGLDPSRARRDRCGRQHDRLRLPEQGVLAHRRADEREQGGGHAGRPSARREARRERWLRRPGRGLRVRQQARRVGNHRAAARARLAAALGASARSGRAADPLRFRVLHGRGRPCGRRRSGRIPTEAPQGAARHRGDQGRGRTRRLADADLAAARPDRQHGVGARHRVFAAQRHGLRGGRRGRHRSHDAARSGRASSPSRTTAGRSSIRMAWRSASRATSCRASAARSWRR